MRAPSFSALAFLIAGMVWVIAAVLDEGNRGIFLILGVAAAGVGLAITANGSDRKT